MNDVNSESILTLASQLGELLEARDLKITTAESCTGGGISEAITAISGSSAWFEYGFVTYANSAKQALLGVTSKSLESYGAVSEQVVVEMAQGALEKSGADIAIAVSGIAGPGGGSEEKPVGTVWLAWAQKGKGVSASRFLFPGDRLQVRSRAVAEGMLGAIRKLA